MTDSDNTAIVLIGTRRWFQCPSCTGWYQEVGRAMHEAHCDGDAGDRLDPEWTQSEAEVVQGDPDWSHVTDHTGLEDDPEDVDEQDEPTAAPEDTGGSDVETLEIATDGGQDTEDGRDPAWAIACPECHAEDCVSSGIAAEALEDEMGEIPPKVQSAVLKNDYYCNSCNRFFQSQEAR